MNCDSCEDPKNSLMTAVTGFALMRSCGMSVSISWRLMRSLIALHANRADAVLVLEQLAHRADAAVAEVVDVVDVALRLAVLEVDEELHHLEHVALSDDGVVERLLDPELVIELEPADLREVVPLGVEEG